MRHVSCLALGIGLISSLSSFATAQVGVVWSGPSGDEWHIAANWTPNVIPDNNTGAIPPIYYTVSIDHPVIIDGGLFDIAGMTNSSAVDTFTSWDFRAGDGNAFLNNTGTFSIIPTTLGVSAYVGIASSNTLTVSGGGAVVLGGGGSARILGGGTLINQNNTFKGEGNIGEGVLTIFNNGVMAATEASPGSIGTLNIYTNAGGFTNTNTLQARNLGHMTLRGDFNNTGGTIVADNGGVVEFTVSPTVTGGTITTGANGTILISSNTTYTGPLTSAGNTVVNGALILSGVITNTGSMTVPGQIRIDTEAELAGNGTIFLTGGSINRVGSNAATLTNHNSIIGTGNVGVSTMSIINASNGVIRANGGVLTIDSGSGFFNNGTMTADGGTLSLTGSNEYFAGSGTFLAANNSAVRMNSAHTVGGVFASTGNGSFVVPVANHAFLDSPSLMTGHFVVNAGGALSIRGALNGIGSLDIIGSTLDIEQSASLNLNTKMKPGVIFGAGSGGTFAPAAFASVGPEAAAPLLYNGGTMQGAGNIGNNELQIINDGSIRGDGGNVGQSNPLTLDPATEGLLNSGIIEAIDLGVVVINGGTGNFTQNGTAVIRALDPGSNVQFLNNPFISGGILGAGGGTISTNNVTLQSLTTDANIFQSGPSAIQISMNVINTGTINIAAGGSLNVNGAGTLNSGSGWITNNGSFVTQSGGNSIAGFITGTGRTTAKTGSVVRAHTIRQGSLVIETGANVYLDSTFTPNVDPSRVGSLSISGTGKLDMADRSLIYDHTGGLTTLTQVRALLASGYNGGAWDGNGINSSSAAANSHFAIASAEASAIYSSFPAMFGDQNNIDNTTTLLKYTYFGDANLDGLVDIRDLRALGLNYNTTGKVWTSGDFNYDNNVNVLDLTLLVSNWQAGVVAPVFSSLELALSSLGLPAIAVPEPGIFAMLTGGFIPLLRSLGRRRIQRG